MDSCYTKLVILIISLGHLINFGLEHSEAIIWEDIRVIWFSFKFGAIFLSSSLMLTLKSLGVMFSFSEMETAFYIFQSQSTSHNSRN